MWVAQTCALSLCISLEVVRSSLAKQSTGSTRSSRSASPRHSLVSLEVSLGLVCALKQLHGHRLHSSFSSVSMAVDKSNRQERSSVLLHRAPVSHSVALNGGSYLYPIRKWESASSASGNTDPDPDPVPQKMQPRDGRETTVGDRCSICNLLTQAN